MSPKPVKLTPATEKLINRIQDEEIRRLLLNGLHPADVVEGWYYAMASGILRIQERK